MTTPPARGLSAAACAAGVMLACTPALEHRTVEMAPIGTVKDVPRTPDPDDTPGDTTTPNSATPNRAKEAACTMADVDDLREALKGCEVPMPKSSAVPPIKGRLEVTATASEKVVAPGGHLDVVLVLKNKTDEQLPLYFTGDPDPRFDVEVFDSRRRRADLPSGKWPGYPKGFTPETRALRAFRIILDKGRSARVKLSWEAVKSKWAPADAATWEGKGYPRAPAGPLPKGKYTVRIAVPLLGGEVAAPTLDVAVRS